MQFSFGRKCDRCKKWKASDLNFLTEQCWVCEECKMDLDFDDFDYGSTSVSSPPPPTQPSPNTDIMIVCKQEDLEDVSRTVSLALSMGKAEFQLSDGRKIIVRRS